MEPGYRITADQQNNFSETGYLLLDNAISDALLQRLRELAEKLEADGLSAHRQGRQLHGCCVVQDPVGPRVMRYDDLLALDPELTLDLLACPAMMAIARQLCGPGTVPLQCDLLYKHQHPHPVIKWHQGAQHPRGYPYLNIGIYLDDAGAGDGCLKYLPGSFTEQLDVTALSRRYGWGIPGVVEQPARANDILIQDMMILHGSEPKRSPGVRRTVYVELRPDEGIRESGCQSEHWLALRQRWMAMVLQRAAAEDWPAAWRAGLPDDIADTNREAQAIIARREPPIPAFYGYESVQSRHYPVPEDLL